PGLGEPLRSGQDGLDRDVPARQARRGRTGKSQGAPRERVVGRIEGQIIDCDRRSQSHRARGISRSAKDGAVEGRIVPGAVIGTADTIVAGAPGEVVKSPGPRPARSE